MGSKQTAFAFRLKIKRQNKRNHVWLSMLWSTGGADWHESKVVTGVGLMGLFHYFSVLREMLFLLHLLVQIMEL